MYTIHPGFISVKYSFRANLGMLQMIKTIEVMLTLILHTAMNGILSQKKIQNTNSQYITIKIFYTDT